VAYILRINQRRELYVNGRSIAQHDDIADLRFLPHGELTCQVRDGKELYFMRARETPDGFRFTRLSPDVLDVNHDGPFLSDDGVHTAYVSGTESARFLVVDGIRIQDACEDGKPQEVVLSADGAALAYTCAYFKAVRDDYSLPTHSAVVVQGKRTEKFSGSQGRLVLSPDGRHVAYRRCAGFLGGVPCELMLDGQAVTGKFDGADLPFFLSDGTFGHMAWDKHRRYVILANRQRYASEASIHHISPSSDGERLAIGVCGVANQDSGWFGALRSRLGLAPAPTVCRMVFGEGAGRGFWEVSRATFSGDGSMIAYLATGRSNAENWEPAVRWGQVVIADQAGERQASAIFDAVWPPVFSSDGKYVAFGARQQGGLWWKVMAIKERS
jgi:hypothetical protein